jgi:outer membrane protein TolC
MQLSYQRILTSVITGFALLHTTEWATANEVEDQLERSQPQLKAAPMLNSILTIDTVSKFPAKHLTAKDLSPLPEPVPTTDQPIPAISNPDSGLPPSPTSDVREKPAQVPVKLDELLASPNLLKNPSKPEEVQIQTVKPLTLNQAIAVVQQNSRQLQVAKVQLDRNRAVLREAQAAWFPTFGLQGSYSRDLSANGELSVDATRGQAQKQIPLLQNQLDQLINQPPSPDPLQQLVQALSIQQTQGQLASAQSSLQGLDNFATRTFNSTLALNYTIFTSGQRPALIKAAGEQVRVSELEVGRVMEQIRLDVTQAYYDVQQGDQQILIQEAAVREAQTSLSNAEALLRGQLATRLDVLNAQVQLDNVIQQLTQIRSQRDTALRRLAQLLSLPPTVGVTATDPIEVTERWNLTLEESIVRAFQNRAELKQQLAQRRASQQQRKAAIAALLPQLRAFANYNLLNFHTDQPGEFVPQGFATGYSFGFSLQWSFFDGGVAFARIAQQDASIKLAEIQFAQATEQVRFDVEQSYFSLQSNLQNVQVASASLDRAREALRIARLRLQAGVGIQLDVLNAETNLTRAQGNLLNAILGYNRALASLRRAVSGVIPNS